MSLCNDGSDLQTLKADLMYFLMTYVNDYNRFSIMDISVCLNGDLTDKTDTDTMSGTNFRPDQYYVEGNLLLLMSSSEEVK